MEWITQPEAWVALATLTAIEIVLGIDNIVFISILVARLPKEQRERARKIGLGLALVTRLGLLFSLVWLMRLTEPWLTILGEAISGRDAVLIAGGLFLLAKSTTEIHKSFEPQEASTGGAAASGMLSVLVQVAILDIIFSLDSIITAVGMAQHVQVMVIAIILAVIVMIFAAGPIGRFVEQHPTLKMLALSFLVLIGVALIGEGLDFHIPKGYIYFAMGFSVAVEFLNLKRKTTSAGVGEEH